MATATLEDLIEFLKKKPSMFEMARNVPLMVDGLENLAQRLAEVERDRVLDLDRMQKLESLTDEERKVLDSVEQDRTALQKAVADLSARVEALEKAKVTPAPKGVTGDFIQLPPSTIPPPAPPAPLAQPAGVG